MKPSASDIEAAITVMKCLEDSGIETFALAEAIEELEEIREFHYDSE